MHLQLPLTKAALLLIASASHYIGLRPPQPPTPQNAYRGQHFETMVLIWAFASRVVIGALSISNALAIVGLRMEPGDRRAYWIMQTVCPRPSANVQRLVNLDTLTVFGITTMLLACALRVWCYTTLGRLFTYRVAIIPGHKLVTSGPYAHARHPSYTGVFLMLTGAAITYLFTPNNYIQECGIMTTPWKWLILYWCACVFFSVLSLVNRGQVEDKLMMETFGKEWHAYYATVPYKFIPFIF
ncbi:hypothetical protein HGRIS_013786 [Hohenbuehelia grisea]|uniref:Protein-S-isoprenylcysteine O-methyltransferase n=1 Tax=Hohenbuehelia grisea TaxID=104357 RepID=A0ABR3IWW3_9AGAR